MAPLIVIIVRAMGTTHISSIKAIEDQYEFKENTILETFININKIAIQYFTSIILHKHCLETKKIILEPRESP